MTATIFGMIQKSAAHLLSVCLKDVLLFWKVPCFEKAFAYFCAFSKRKHQVLGEHLLQLPAWLLSGANLGTLLSQPKVFDTADAIDLPSSSVLLLEVPVAVASTVYKSERERENDYFLNTLLNSFSEYVQK